MKYYKSPDNNVFAYELDGSQDHLISENFVSISEQDANAINQAKANKVYQEWLASQPTKEEQIAKLQEQIDALKG